MEENRGISLRPLLTELAAELRAGAPEAARGLAIDLELDPVNTTQDVAVAVAFLITEIVEFAMLNCPNDPVEISLRRTSELTARLTLSSPVLDPGRRRRAAKRCSSNGLSAGWPSSCDRRSSASWAATALICLSFRRCELEPAIRYGCNRKNFGIWPELIAKKPRCAVRIVTFCPPALAIRLNGPGTANPPPPRWRFRALFCLGLSNNDIVRLTARLCAPRASG